MLTQGWERTLVVSMEAKKERGLKKGVRGRQTHAGKTKRVCCQDKRKLIRRRSKIPPRASYLTMMIWLRMSMKEKEISSGKGSESYSRGPQACDVAFDQDDD